MWNTILQSKNYHLWSLKNDSKNILLTAEHWVLSKRERVIMFREGEKKIRYGVIFLTGPPLKMFQDWPPHKFLDWPPLQIIKV